MAEMEKKVIEIEVTTDMLEDIKGIAKLHLWEPEEGARMVLGAGIGALQAERVSEARTDAEKILLLSRLLAEAEGRLAAARFDLAEANEAVKRWELSSGTIRELAISLEETIRRQNKEIDELKARLQAAGVLPPTTICGCGC